MAEPCGGLCLRVEFDVGEPRYEVFSPVGPQLACAKIDRPVQDVEQHRVAVELADCDRNAGFTTCIADHRLAVVALLRFDCPSREGCGVRMLLVCGALCLIE